MERYVVGWDGGGTKTAMQIRSAVDGKLKYEFTAGGLNFNSNTKDEIKSTIHSLVSKMKTLTGSLDVYLCLCIATAGISNPEAITFLRETIKSCDLVCKLKFVGDQEAALFGALGKKEGIIIISGTGSICYGRNQEGKEFRTGGWGHIIDDEGSGYAIGRDILSNAVKSFDKRISKSILYDLVLEKLGGKTVNDIIQFTYNQRTGKKDIASLAPILLEAIKIGDEAAVMIGKNAAIQLFQLIYPVVNELDFKDSELALTGGILTHYHLIRKELEVQIKKQFPGLKIVEAKHNSVNGAALYAFDVHKKESC